MNPAIETIRGQCKVTRTVRRETPVIKTIVRATTITKVVRSVCNLDSLKVIV